MSKKNRTLTELQENLTKDWQIRRNELSLLKDEFDKCDFEKKNLFAKTLIMLLYAHWEGFIKYSSECFLQYIHHLNLKFNDLDYGLFTICNLEIIKNYIESNVTLKIEALKTIFDCQEITATIPYNYSIATYSKLNSETLNEICLIVGIDSTNFLMKKPIIDKRLVDLRNSVSHGNLVRVEIDELKGTYEAILNMLSEFSNLIQNKAFEIHQKQNG